MLTTASPVSGERFVFIIIPPSHGPLCTGRAGTASLARLQNQGGGEVNDGGDADDRDAEIRCGRHC